MANAKLIHQEWTVEVRFNEAEVPDVPKSYTSITMRPFAATIKFAASEDGKLKVDSINLHGHRVNKSGLGAGVTARIYSHQLPEWLTPVIEQARGRFTRD